MVLVSAREAARRSFSFPFGWRKSLYGSMRRIAVGMVRWSEV